MSTEEKRSDHNNQNNEGAKTYETLQKHPLSDQEPCKEINKDQYAPLFWSSFYQKNLNRTIGELSFQELHDHKILYNNFTPELGQRFHFLGIGGIGMSSLAQALHSYGSYVQGSDGFSNRGPSSFLREQYNMLIEQEQENLAHTDPFWEKIFQDMNYLVVTSAVVLRHPALLYCHKHNIPILHRSIVLREIIKPYRVIGVTGSHGKTTTTALLGYLLDKLGLDPLIICGGFMQNYQNTIRLGSGAYAVVELDESDDSYLNYGALESCLLMSLSEEHNSLEKLTEKFQILMNNTRNTSFVFANGDDLNVKRCFPLLSEKQKFGYGVDCSNVIEKQEKNLWLFENKEKGIRGYIETPFSLTGPHHGYHISAALSVIQTVINCERANLLKIMSYDALSAEAMDFQGVDRRLTFCGMIQNIPFFDDYANHPFTIKHMIEYLKTLFTGRLWIIFEPHRYSRFSQNFDAFVDIFSDKINVLVTPIYHASEEDLWNCSLEDFVTQIKHKKDTNYHTTFTQTPMDAAQILMDNIQAGDSVTIFGSGSCTFFIREAINIIQSRGGFHFEK